MPSVFRGPVGLLIHQETETLHLAALPGRGGQKSPRHQPGRSCSAFVSPVQFGTWVLEKLEARPSQNVICRAFSWNGQITVPALAEAFQKAIQRNEVLRSRFRLAEGLQSELLPPEMFSLEIVDLGGLSPPVQQNMIHEVADRMYLRTLDPERGPLIRAILLTRPGDEGVFLLAVHRILADEWSLALVLSEILDLYSSRVMAQNGAATVANPIHECNLPECSLEAIHPADAASAVLDPNRIEWPVLELPRDRGYSMPRRYQAEKVEFQLSTQNALMLRNVSISMDEHPATLLCACFQILLGRWSSSEDVTVAVRRESRSTESANMIGSHACIVPVPVSLAGHPSFKAVVSRVNAACVQAACLTGAAMEAVFERVARHQSSDQSAFQAAFDFVEIVPETFQYESVNLRSIEVGQTWAGHELALRVADKEGSFACSVIYDCDLFEPETIRWIANAFERLVCEVCKAPDRQIAAFDLLTDGEREEILVGRNFSRTPGGIDRSVLDELALHARLAPDAVAAVCGSDHLTYGGLEELSNRMSGMLQSLAIKPGTCVALCGRRGLSMLAAMLGIMRAGAVYLPLDPVYPDSQISFMLEDSKAVLLLTNGGAASRFAGHSVRSLDLEEAIRASRNMPDATSSPLPASLAYVMYTSGSTGAPKGAMISHSGMWHHVWAKARDLGLDKTDIVAQTASCSFDISIWQFLSSLVAGAKVAVVTDDIASDAAWLMEQLRQLSVTVWETVPVLMGVIIDQARQLEGWDHRLPALRCVISNADALTTDMARQWCNLFPDAELVNTYGATEASDDATHYWVERTFTSRAVHVALGAPIGDSTVYVLDDNMLPVMPCFPGEIYIGGPGVAPGYLNQPCLTAERFVPDSFSSQPGGRLYRTGDRGRWSANGDLEFLGRVDHQIKIRGHRVEPDEIAVVLRNHSMVRQSAVVASRNGQGTVLSGFVVWREGAAGNPDELRTFLKASLPEYMVPSVILELPELPMTPNGKLDRKALNQLLHAHGYVPPRTPTEAILSEIGTELLGLERIGVHDDFFASGDARKAVRMISRIRSVLEIEVPLKVIFESRSIEALAAAIETIHRGEYDSREPGPEKAKLFLLLNRMLQDARNFV